MIVIPAYFRRFAKFLPIFAMAFLATFFFLGSPPPHLSLSASQIGAELDLPRSYVLAGTNIVIRPPEVTRDASGTPRLEFPVDIAAHEATAEAIAIMTTQISQTQAGLQISPRGRISIEITPDGTVHAGTTASWRAAIATSLKRMLETKHIVLPDEFRTLSIKQAVVGEDTLSVQFFNPQETSRAQLRLYIVLAAVASLMAFFLHATFSKDPALEA